jgi:hypothetical protein
MVYIFVLLYIAIQTILGIAGGSTKRLLANVIVSAILINFSLFFTKVVIDSGNIIAKTFWDNIRITQGTDTINSFSAWAITGSKLQTSLDPKSDFNKTTTAGLGNLQQAMMFFGGALILFIMGYVFLAGSVMMVGRIIGLIFAMILSPWAFLGIALPKFNYFDRWFGDLCKHTFSAPLLVFFLYLITLVVQTNDAGFIAKSQACGFAQLFAGETPGCFTIVLQYLIMVMLMLGALEATSKMSTGIGKKAGGISKSMLGFVGGAGLGAAGYMGRQTIGRAGRMAAENKTLRELASKGGVAGKAYTLVRDVGVRAQQSSFDARGSKAYQATAGRALGAAGIRTGEAGGKGGYKATGSVVSQATRAATLGTMSRGYAGTDYTKKVIDEKSKQYEDETGLLERNLKMRFGEKTVKDSKLFKDVRNKIEKSKRDETAKRTYEEAYKKYKTLTDKTPGDERQKVVKDFASALNKLDSKEYLKREKDELLAVAPMTQAKHLRAMAASDDFDGDTMEEIFNKIMTEAEAKVKAGESPRKIHGYHVFSEAKPESKWNIDPDRVEKLKEATAKLSREKQRTDSTRGQIASGATMTVEEAKNEAKSRIITP